MGYEASNRLPILGKIYEEFIPTEEILDDEGFKALK